MTNFITLLITIDQNIAAKTFHRQPDGRIKESSYRCGSFFRHRQIEIAGIDDLLALLLAIETETQSAFLIQGEVSPEFREREEITRTLHSIPAIQQTAMIRSIPDGSQWLCCDFDKIDLPAGLTPQQGVEMLVKTLPAEFLDVSYCYQLSSSAGITGPGFRMEKQVDANGEAYMVEKNFDYPGWSKISAHVFFWLTRKHRNLAQWAKNLNATRGKKVIDPAFLETVQPNYCACPRFIGTANPVPADQRSGLVRKAADAVELVWIDEPIRYVEINNTAHRVGAHVQKVGKTYLATPSLQDRLAMIGQGGSYREPLKSCLGYYYWLKGCTADSDEISSLIRNAPINWAGRDYMGQHLDDLVSWFAGRNTHEPISRLTLDDALQARLIEWRPDAPKFPDTLPDDLDNWVFDLEESGLEYYFIEGECGEGKTEWLIDRVATKPTRYLVCLPRIDMIREVSARLLEKHPAIEQTHLVHTIFTDKENDIRDEEDAEDAFAANGTTVTYQIYPAQRRTRKSLGEMIRKLSVT